MAFRKARASGSVYSPRAKAVELRALFKERVACEPSHSSSGAGLQASRIMTSATTSWNGTLPVSQCIRSIYRPTGYSHSGLDVHRQRRGLLTYVGGSLKRQIVFSFLLAAAVSGIVSEALALTESHLESSLAQKSRLAGEIREPLRSYDTPDPITSLLQVVENRQPSWVLSTSKRTAAPLPILCGSALYGGLKSDGTRFVDLKESANCRSICRALVHRRGRSCLISEDPHACVVSSIAESWVPDVYKRNCIFTRPDVQQPDFARSECSEVCLYWGMDAWLAGVLRGNASWDSFAEQVPWSCRFRRIGPTPYRMALKTQTSFPRSRALRELSSAEMRQFQIITRKLRRGNAQQAESTVVPVDYWDSLSSSEKRDWMVTQVFYAPSDESHLTPFLQALYGSQTGQAICLFRVAEGKGERFGMIPGRNCIGSIGVLLVAALAEYPTAEFDAASKGFDLCVARRVFQGKTIVGDSVIKPLQLKTRVTVGTPCGVSSGLESGAWEVAFYASLYPQARGIDGLPSSGECPWKGSFQLNSKCFVKYQDDHLDFFSANAACQGLTEGTGFAPEDASLAVIDSDRELKFLGEMVSKEGLSWIGLFQPEQIPVVSPGIGEAYRIEEQECLFRHLHTQDGLGSRLSAIRDRCLAARSWPSWRSVNEDGLGNSWDPLFCDSHPRTRDSSKFTDCAALQAQSEALPCLVAQSCDTPHPVVCSVKLRRGPQLISNDSNGNSGVPVLTCRRGEDCWLELWLPTDASRTYDISERSNIAAFAPFIDRHHVGALALMMFCGAGPILVGPWPVTSRTNLSSDNSMDELDGGIYEICFCSPAQFGDITGACTAAKDFSFIRGFLRWHHGSGDGLKHPGLPEVTLKPVPGAAAEDSALLVIPKLNELSPRVVFCNVSKEHQIESTCSFELQTTSLVGRPAALSFVPLDSEVESETVCAYPETSIQLMLNALTEVKVPPLVPTSIKYAICADELVVGTLVASEEVKKKVDLPDMQRISAVSLSSKQLLRLKNVEVVFPDGRINNPFIEVTVEGLGSKKAALGARIAVFRTRDSGDVGCFSDMLMSLGQGDQYSGDFLEEEDNFVVRFPAPATRMKMCLLSPLTSRPRVLALGSIPPMAKPLKFQSIPCSLPPGNCSISLKPDSTAKQTGHAYFPKTTGIKLLRGNVSCPDQPDDPQYDAFKGSPEDAVALLGATAVTMTQTSADTSAVEFSLDSDLRRWLVDVGIASVCMTQIGFENSGLRCWETDTCTTKLGYMVWTGPTQANSSKVFICVDDAPCSVNIQGKMMDSQSMAVSRLAALKSCGTLDGEGVLTIASPSDSNEIRFVVQQTSNYDRLELCWNPGPNPGSNLIEYTIPMGQVLFLRHPVLESLTVQPSQTTEAKGEALVISVKSALSRAQIFGSAKLYFKAAPTGDSWRDTCSYEADVALSRISTLISVTDVSQLGGDTLNLGQYIAPVPRRNSSLCWVQFADATNALTEFPFGSFLAMVPGSMLPTGKMNIVCSLDETVDCEGNILVEPVQGRDNRGRPLPIISSIVTTFDAFLVPSSCPSDPRDLQTLPTTTDYLGPEKVSAKVTDRTLTITLDPMSQILAQAGEAAICLLDTECEEPLGEECISTVGSATWVGPSKQTKVVVTCTSLEAGECEVSIPGFRMKSIDYNVPRLAAAGNWDSPNTSGMSTGILKKATDDKAVFSIPAMSGWELGLYWNANSLVASKTSKKSSDYGSLQFSERVGTINFLPLPVVTNRSVSRKSAVTASVIIDLSVLLNQEGAEAVGKTKGEGLWNGFTREPFTDGSQCSSNSVPVDLKQVGKTSIKKSPVRSRHEGSAEETGITSSDALVALMSFEIEPAGEPFTYCWHTAILGAHSQIIRESWTRLIDVPAPSDARFGGTFSVQAMSLGFVPCMSSTAEASACTFSVVPADETNTAFFPHGQPWVLSNTSTVILLPGETDCPPGTSEAYNAELLETSDYLDIGGPLRLSPESIAYDSVAYRFDGARSWLSENGSATICWRNDHTLNVVKIANALWLGPFNDRRATHTVCQKSATCTLWVHGKNLTKLDHSFSRVAVLQKCGVADGVGVAQMRSTRSGSASFITLTTPDEPNLVTVNDLEPVRFWGLPGKTLQASCKHGTSVEFLQATWVDTRGICDQIDVLNLLSARCNGRKRCTFLPLGSHSAESSNDLSGAQLFILDSCDDVNVRKLLGTYRCADTRDLLHTKSPLTVRERVGAPAMLQLSSADDNPDNNKSMDDSKSGILTDESISYWISQEKPGVYEVCWNGQIKPTVDASAFAESLGTVEILPGLSLVDESVSCSASDVSSCSLQITVSVDGALNLDQTVGLVIAEQDGASSCEAMTWDELVPVVIEPHQSDWNLVVSSTKLFYSAPLPMESGKLCAVPMAWSMKYAGSMQYIGNVPGYSAPRKSAMKTWFCSGHPTQPCTVELIPEGAAVYFRLDNRVSGNDESATSFDAFKNLKPYLAKASTLYGVEGGTSCPSNPADETYQGATESPRGGIAKFVLEEANISSFKYLVTDVQQKWLGSVLGLTLCWVMPSCVENPLKNGTRPCTRDIGKLYWSGPELAKPVPTVRCRMTEGCAFVVKGTNMELLPNLSQRVAFLKQCGSSEGPGVGFVTEYPRGYVQASSDLQLGSKPSFLAVNSSLGIQEEDSGTSVDNGQSETWDTLAFADSLTVVSPVPVEDSVSVCWDPLGLPKVHLTDFVVEIGKAVGYGVNLIEAYCLSNSVCGMKVTTRGAALDPSSLKLRAFTEQCGVVASVPKRLPNEGRLVYSDGKYSFETVIGPGEEKLETYKVCWCDEITHPQCDLSHYRQTVGRLQIQFMKEIVVTCLEVPSSQCRVSLPSSVALKTSDSYVFLARKEANSSKLDSCRAPHLSYHVTRDLIRGDRVDILYTYGHLSTTTLLGNAISICVTRSEVLVRNTHNVEKWRTAYLGNLIVADRNVSGHVYAGIIPKISITFVGLLETQATVKSLPDVLHKVYLKDAGKCSSATTDVSLPLVVQPALTSKGSATFVAAFSASKAVDMVVPEGVEKMPQLSLCWCLSQTVCTSSRDFQSEITTMTFYSPARGISHECTHDSTCLLRVKDIPYAALQPFNPQLLIRSDCSDATAEPRLPDQGIMRLRVPSGEKRSEGTALEEHMYGFQGFVSRETAFDGLKQLQKRICYCADSTDCSPQRLVDIGQIRITDVWDSSYRVAVTDAVDVPIHIKKPLNADDRWRIVRVTRGTFSNKCHQGERNDICTTSLLSFPEETWSSKEPAVLEYYDSTIPLDDQDHREYPFIRVASLIPTGPWSKHYKFFCMINSTCEIKIDVLNGRMVDRVALKPLCGKETEDSVGFSTYVEKATGSPTAQVFRWKPFQLSEAAMKSGLELCWRSVEDESGEYGDLSDYTAKFGTLSFRVIFPNQDRTCYIGAECQITDLQAQNLESDSYVKLLEVDCGLLGGEKSEFPNRGLLKVKNASPDKITFTSDGPLPVLGIKSLAMCYCNTKPCDSLAHFGWRIGELTIKGPESLAPLATVFKADDLSLRLTGEFDDKFYLLLKSGTSCAGKDVDTSFSSQAVSVVIDNEAQWEAFEGVLGPLSVCLCHDSVGGLSNPFASSDGQKRFCGQAANYATKVGQFFVSGPFEANEPFRCQTGSFCSVSIDWLALESLDVKQRWAQSKVHAQRGDCRNPDTAVLAGGSYISDIYSGETLKSEDVNYPFSFEQRLSVYRFHSSVTVGAGDYSLCWAAEGGSFAATLGSLRIDGPFSEEHAIWIFTGLLFDITVRMSSVVSETDASSFRIRPYRLDSDSAIEDFDCRRQPYVYKQPDTFGCESIYGPPSALRSKDGGSLLVWENTCALADELATDAKVGDMYAVCFCDGRSQSCDEAEGFQTLVQVLKLIGPEPLNQSVLPHYRAGVEFSLEISGVDLSAGAVIGLCPEFNVLDNTRYTCRSPDKELLGVFTGTVSDDRKRATFDGVYVPFTIPQGILCWCSEGICDTSEQFIVQLGRYSVAGPTFIMPRVVVGSYFTVQLTGSALHRNDAISIRSALDTCGGYKTELMDPDYVLAEPDRPLDMLGTVESFVTSDNSITGEKEMIWTSWPMRIKESAEGYLKICYCSSTLVTCGSRRSMSVLVGLLELRGPSRGSAKFVASEDQGEYLIVSGTSLSTRNSLKYFQYISDEGPPTPEEEAELCSSAARTMVEGITVFPDAVNPAGTEQYFPVKVQLGTQYVACWSFGEDTSSTLSSSIQQESLPSFFRIGELLSSRSSKEEEENSATKALDEGRDGSTAASEQEMSRSQENPEKWFFVSLFSKKGFQQGVHHVVVGHEDTVVVNGVINATDAYTAVLGKSHETSDCTEIFKNSSLRSNIGVTTSAVSESRMVLKLKAASQLGWHKLCINNTTASEIFDAGTVEVTSYFQKTGVDMFGTRKTFVLPCITGTKNSSGETVWDSPRVWLPDGTGLWTADIHAGSTGAEEEYSMLKVKWPPEDNFQEFPELRNVLACDTTKEQEVLVLGAAHLLVIYPEKSGKKPKLINHGVPYPADVTTANNQVFITSFDSHLITSFSLTAPGNIFLYEPTEPTLLSAGGIQAIQNIDGNETSIFVADTVGGMIGRLRILPEDVSSPPGTVVSREWTAVFGKQKSDYRNTEGVRRPFCVGEFVTTYSTQEKMNPLLLVGELISDRITFLSLDGKELSFYRQINLGVTKFITGLRITDDVMLLTSKKWSGEQELGSAAEIVYITFSQLIDNVYFTYPDFTKKLQAGLRYRFVPLVTGQDIQFFREDAEAGDPLQSMGFTLDSKTGEIEGTLTATVTSKVVIVGGDLLGSYTWSFEFEAGCQSGEYFNESSNTCEPCPLGTFRDEETELQRCKDHKAYSTTLQIGSTNLSQCVCIEGYEIGTLGNCSPCSEGTYKVIAADAKCTGRCPQHMSSNKTGAESLEDLNCQCEPGFYLTDSGCQSCQIGSYCAGKLSPPVQCPEFQTTADAASAYFSDCVCTAGHYRVAESCVPCDILTYKPLIGDQACTKCPQPASGLVEDRQILASSSAETAMFSSRKGATQQSQCEVCASGYYFDSVSVGGCVPCKKDHYCPGFLLGMLACKNNSVTAGIGAESVFQCGCPKGYGRATNRNPLDLNLVCVPCPSNYFQHVEGADSECIPCPANSMTKSTMSTSITSCVAKPGFSAVENLQALTNGDENSDAEEYATSFVDAIDLAKDVEKAYETITDDDLLSIKVFCKEGSSAIEDYDMAEFVTTLYTSSLAACQTACLENVYCTSFSFIKEDTYPTHTNSIMNYTGIYTLSYWPCRLYMFGSGAAADVQDWTGTWQGTEVEPGKAVGCVVGRVKDELTWQRFRYLECPPNAYCPGDKEANVFECKDYAVTLSSGAYSGDHCICVPGHEPVGHVCEQCKLGYYKNTTENVACTECPQFFTTSITASTSAYECACQPGMYMAPAGTTEFSETRSLLPQLLAEGAIEPVTLEAMAQSRSLRELGKHGELQPVPLSGASMTELLRLPWLEEGTREQLEKEVELGVCMPCHQGMFCPGLWKDSPTNSTHMPPQQCIEGSRVPVSTVNADSVEKCLCLAGYAYGRSSDTALTSDSYFTCSKCSPGTYKELQENAPCSGRCMKDAETYPGAVSKTQCFCQVGRYAVESDDSEGLFSCIECVEGGVCTGGFKRHVIKAIEEDPGYANVTISDHTIPYPQKGWFATFKLLSQELWRPENSHYTMGLLHSTLGDDDENFEEYGKPTAFLEAEYDRVPDIHPCPVDYRCRGGPTNSCSEGGSGYLCSKCEKGYDMNHHGAVCTKCGSMWYDLGWLLVSRLLLCIIIWGIAAVSCLAVQNPSCIHPILIRIWLSNFFLFFLFGFFPENSVSALVEWASIYRAVFTYPVFVFSRYPKIFCIFEELGFPMDFRTSWYIQKFVQLLVPVADICILTLICGISLVLYKVYKHSKIQRVKLVLIHAREVHAGDIWAMRTAEKIQDTRCLGLFHYISPPGATSTQKILRFFGDLVPAFMIVWFWNLPFLVIECTQLLGCVSISYKDEPPLILLTAMPEQECSLTEPWFLAGLIVGASGILVWGIGSVILLCVWMLYTDNADRVESRFRYGFLSNGYEFQYRAWEMVLMARKLACACLLTLQLHMNPSGTQEIFRNSINLLIATMCLILQLLIEPYDRRSHNLTNRVEFMGLLTNVINCIVIQGSFSFSVFRWLGPLPLVTCGLFHMYIFWSLFVEAGRMVLMRPHLARLPSPWRYFNLVTRSLARLYTQGNAKVYYNYITKEMVLEAAAKSRLFHIRRMIHGKKKSTDYRKINYENRTYFVSALTDSLSRLVISWCQFTIPGDWLDFTIRYSFCYCFWMRHRVASVREPLDLEEFDALRPSLFNECYVETEENDEDGLLASETQCNEVEAEFLDMMVDDDVYDDSPVTLMELYVAVQSMRYIPKSQLRRLHMWYRERMAAAGSSDMAALRKENEELEAEVQQLSDLLRNRFGAPEEGESAFNMLDFFFTVEMVHEAEAETARIRKEIDKEVASIMNARAARSVAERFHMELEKVEGEDIEGILESFDEDIAARQEKTTERMDYLQPALVPAKKKVKTREKSGAVVKRRLSRLGSRGGVDERKRVLRPSFSSRSEGKKSVSPPRTLESIRGKGRTIAPVGLSDSDSAARRRISLDLNKNENGTLNAPQIQSSPAKRISLSANPVGAPDQAGVSFGEGSGSSSTRRTLRSASIQGPLEPALSSASQGTSQRTLRSASIQGRVEPASSSSAEGTSRRTLRSASIQGPVEPAPSITTQGTYRRTLRSASIQGPVEPAPSIATQGTSRRTLRSASLQKSSESPPSSEMQSESSGAEAPRRRVSRVTAPSGSSQQETSPRDASPAAKRSLRLFKKPQESEDDKP